MFNIISRYIMNILFVFYIFIILYYNKNETFNIQIVIARYNEDLE